MPIFKEVTVETEAWQVGFREHQKERMEEVKKIREAIVELYDANPGENPCVTGFRNKEILEWLISKGFKVNARQISPKMKMMTNVFYEIRIDGKEVWRRWFCDVCEKPLKLNEEFTSSNDKNLHGHSVCLQFVFKIIDKNNDQFIILREHIVTLTAQRVALQDELNRLRSMVEFPSENANKGTRKIILD